MLYLPNSIFIIIRLECYWHEIKRPRRSNLQKHAEGHHVIVKKRIHLIGNIYLFKIVQSFVNK